jgi:Tfp pilus assembly protein PilV
MRRGPRGFTLLEVLVALVVLEVGVLGLLATVGAATRLLGRARRAARSAAFAASRLERLRVTACANRAGGAEIRTQGDVLLDSLTWRFIDAGNGHWRIVLRTRSRTDRQGWGWRTDSIETGVSCPA